jgi:hypothetical protein
MDGSDTNIKSVGSATRPVHFYSGHQTSELYCLGYIMCQSKGYTSTLRNVSQFISPGLDVCSSFILTSHAWYIGAGGD